MKALLFAACLALAPSVAAAEVAVDADATAESKDAGVESEAGMTPPDEDDPGNGCSCFWKDESPEGSAALGVPWLALLVLRRATKRRG